MTTEDNARRERIERERRRRQEVARRLQAGEIAALPDLTDEEMGDEAVRLVKESRRRRGHVDHPG